MSSSHVELVETSFWRVVAIHAHGVQIQAYRLFYVLKVHVLAKTAPLIPGSQSRMPTPTKGAIWIAAVVLLASTLGLLQHSNFTNSINQTLQHLDFTNPVNQTRLDDYHRVGADWYVKSPTLEGYDVSTLGKSCAYDAYDEYSTTWKCRECFLNKNNSAPRCCPLKRRGHCNPFPRESWKLRAFSEYDPKSSLDMEMRTLRNVQNGNRYYEKQPLCMPLSSCFNLSRCDASILTIYNNETTTTENSKLIEYAVKNSPLLKQVDRFEDACLSVVFPTTYISARAMREAQHWNMGMNNLLWRLSDFQFNTWNGDYAFNTFHVERAAVASSGLNRPQVRPGYDQVLPLYRIWARPMPPQAVDIHRPRKWLLSFRGGIQDVMTPYYQHRWLAAEYWENAMDVLVDVSCRRHGKPNYKNYSLPGTIYPAMMINSTFGFAPGGSGVGSYRFGEYLSTATIPVVVDDFVAPLYPEIDWSGCIVRVSESRIIDLPRILRGYTAQDIASRQKRCWQIHEIVYGEHQTSKGWVHDYRVTFTKALEIWSARVASEIYKARQIDSLMHDQVVL